MTDAVVKGVDEVEVGEYRNIDDYTRSLKDAGYQASYENVWSGTNGFTAILSVEGTEHAVFEGGTGGHLVKEVTNSLRECRGENL